MNKKELAIKIILSVISFAILIGAFLFVSKKEEAQNSGIIIIELINLENVVVETKSLEFNQGDKLISLLDLNFEIKYHSSIYGAFITKINDLEVLDENDYFIQININDKYSSVGISQIKLINGIKISFILTKIG